METADIRRPPGDARQTHIQARAHLVPQGGKAGMDIAAPDKRALSLGTRPGTAQQVEDILLTGRLLAVIEGFGIADRIDIPYL